VAENDEFRGQLRTDIGLQKAKDECRLKTDRDPARSEDPPTLLKPATRKADTRPMKRLFVVLPDHCAGSARARRAPPDDDAGGGGWPASARRVAPAAWTVAEAAVREPPEASAAEAAARVAARPRAVQTAAAARRARAEPTGNGGAGGNGVTTITGSLVGLVSGTPIADLQVCLYQNASVPCVKTGAAGSYSLSGVPANQEVLLEYTKASYLSTLVTVKTVAGPMSVGVLAPTKAEADALASMVRTTINPAKGHILVTAFQGLAGRLQRQDNVTASISPKSGVGPYYLNASNFPTRPDGDQHLGSVCSPTSTPATSRSRWVTCKACQRLAPRGRNRSHEVEIKVVAGT
jgi:hypothetical protein